MKNFLKSNWAYLIWAFIYMLLCFDFLGATWQAFFITIIAYGISMTIAISPVGEWILRELEGLRLPATREEQEYLEEIFEEVYENARIENSKLKDGIQIFIMDRMYVNAFAIGRRTIAVTRGAMDTFTQEELKGIIGHEFGHLSHGDTMGLLLNIVGNGIFSILIVITRFVILIMQIATTAFSENFVFYLVFQYIRFMLEVFALAFMLIGEIVLALNSRQSEYFADKFSSDIGYNEELTSALYIIQKISLPAKTPILERIRASHPNTANRIARLENMQFE